MKVLSIIMLIATVLVASVNVSKADTKQEIEKANKKGLVVFLVVTEKGNSQNQSAANIANEAQKSHPKSSVIELDRSNQDNSSLVQKYRLAGAPTPLILVIASNGAVVGGSPLSGLTADALVKMVPSPKLEEVYESVGAGKPAIVVFTKKSFKDRTEVLNTVKESLSILKNNATLIEVNIDDGKEENFLGQMRIKKSATSSTVVVINKQGQVSGTATTSPDAKKLAAAATATPKSGCGPGCGPAGCGK